MLNQGPWRITFDTNPDDCNLACIMCEDHSPYSKTQQMRISAGLRKRRMSFDLIEKVIIEAKSLGIKEIIPSTMGEPLVYKHFESILALCHQHQIKLNLTTNGTFPIKGAAAWAKVIVPVTSDVKISWNGATKQTQEIIMRGTKWEKVLENVKTFISIRDHHALTGENYCRVTFQMTFIEQNIHELADVVALAIDLGVDRVKGHHLWIHFEEMAQADLRRDANSISRWNVAVTRALEIAQQRKLPNGKKILLENFSILPTDILHQPTLLGDCPFLGKEAWIATDGRFNPCCAPDKERRLLGEFGNLQQQTLTSIWQSDAYQQLQQHYTQHAVCQKCNMRKAITV